VPWTVSALGLLDLGLGRTRLLHGEWLRRERRKADARVHLDAALESFERIGAVPWAERARTELTATGTTLRRTAGPGSAGNPKLGLLSCGELADLDLG
jgi:hypothetical protein